MLDPEITGTRIVNWRDRIGMSQNQLAHDCGISQPTLSRIEAGQRIAKMDELVAISWSLGCPIETLLEKNPLEDRVKFAARVREGNPDLTAAREHLVFLLRMNAFLDKNNIPDREQTQYFAASMSESFKNSNEARGRELAEDFRRDLDLGLAPILDMADLIESQVKVHIAVIAMPDQTDGMLVIDPEDSSCVIAVNATNSPTRQRSTLAHELGHLLARETVDDLSAICGRRTNAEIIADVFARHFLAPQTGVTKLLKSRGVSPGKAELSDLSAVIRHYMVSPKIALIQMRQAGWASNAKFKEWQSVFAPALATRHGWRAEYDAWAAESATSRPPARLMARAIQGYIAGTVPVPTLAQIRKVTPDVISDELNEAGIFPAQQDINWFDFGSSAQ